jgi:hypothetical protein
MRFLGNSCRIAIFLAAVVIAVSLPRSATAGVIYTTGFEGMPVGEYPWSNWHMMFSGNAAYVCNSHACSGSNSFRIESLPMWARADYVQLPSLPDFVFYAANVHVETDGRGGGVGFIYVDPNASSTFWAGNAIMFDNDGMIRFYSRSLGAVDLTPWSANQWYYVLAKIDYTTLKADVFVNGVKLGQGLPAEPRVLTYYGTPVRLDKFGFFGNNFSGDGVGTLFLDDVTLVGDISTDAGTSSWGRIKALYR